MGLLKDIRGDYERHQRQLTNAGVWALATWRFGKWARELPTRPLRRAGSKVYGGLALMVRLGPGVCIELDVTGGDGLKLLHASNIYIHPDTVLGRNVSLMHDVTLGTNGERVGAPTLEDDVFVGAGAKILGPITVGKGATIGANSLVITDIPPGTTAMGVPARVSPFSGPQKQRPKKATRSTES
jgi:serine O-acetyltransferase